MLKNNFGRYCLFITLALPLCAQTVLISGLDSPFRLGMTAAGNILVTEATQTVNTGRIAIVDRSGKRAQLLAGLPSVVDNGLGIGATAVILRDRTLYVLIGEGDVLINATAPGTEVPNPKGPSSPIFSSLLAVTFSADPETLTAGFSMTAADHLKLADGNDLTLDNGAGATAVVTMLTDFKDYVPDSNTITRASDPFGMEFDRDNPNMLWVTDSGRNSLRKVDVTTGRARTFLTFPPIPNTAGFGPPVIDVVPTSVHLFGSYLLVSYLTGYPFTPGSAGAYLVNPATGAFQPFIKNRTTVMDAVVRDWSPRPQFFVLEFSANLAAATPPPPPGQLLQYDTEIGKTLQPGLVTPVGIVLDSKTGELFVSEAATGRIVRIQAQ